MLRDYQWRPRYATSQMPADGRQVDILHDFYIPALERSSHYDRVAGFFTSSSLAAASQGFSRFVAKGGHARFIVGTEMRFDDVRTIMELSRERVEQNLLQELDAPKSWPDDVEDGVALLAWMVKHGHLEVRVGLRTHKTSRTVESMEYSGDGYLHEKWAIFSDGEDELYISGSLNESSTALSVNAENLNVQPSWVDWNKEALEECHQNFEALWANDHPAIEVYKMPEAVHKRLVKFADRSNGYREIDGTSVQLPHTRPHTPDDRPKSDRPSLQEQLIFSVIRLAPLLPGGRYVGMETSPVTPWPHQRFVARRLIDTYPCNHLLADEVGLGKTIEAGLAFRSLWLSGRARSIRIFAPASLTSQWLHEMAEKFLMPFRRRTGRRGNAEIADPITGEIEFLLGEMFDFPLEVISTGLINHAGPTPLLARLPKTDLVILDEAHKARRAAPDRTDREAEFNKLFRALRDHLYKKSKGLLLATATPMQLNRVEAFDLLKTMPSAGTVQFSEDLCAIFYELRAKILDDQRLEEHESEWLRRYLLDVERSAPVHWNFVLERVLEIQDRVPFETFVRHGIQPPDWQTIQPALSMCAPLGRAMLRHNRKLLREYQQAGLLKENLAFREVAPKVVPLDGLERTIYDELQIYCGELSENIGANSEESYALAAVGFYLSFLRQRFASSFHSLRQSLKRRLVKIDRTLKNLAVDVRWETEDGAEELEEEEAVKLVLKNRTEPDLTWEYGAVEGLLARMEQLPAAPRKTIVLLEAIQARRIGATERVRQMVVFTRFSDTLNHLHEVLCNRLPGCPIGTFSGKGGTLRAAQTRQKTSLDRTEVRKRFMQGEIDILLCTDAAAEGLNLQSADLLVNFDLPWNPMLLEQRIGRIDRIGQHHKRITVHNYLYQSSVEEVVYIRLVDRFKSAIEVAGELQFSLLPVGQQDFEDHAKSKKEPGYITETELLERANEQARRISERQRLIEFDAKRQRRIYDELERESSKQIQAATLDAIWKALTQSAYLKDLGFSIEIFELGEALSIHNLPGVPEGDLITASRDLYERGLPGKDDRRLHFASYGDTLFEAILEHFLIDQPDVIKAWNDRRGVMALRIGESEVRSVNEAEQAEVSGCESAISIALSASEPAEAQQDNTGRIQYRVLMDGIAKVAEEKLSAGPDTPANHLAKVDSFERDLAHRRRPLCMIPIKPDEKAALAAVAQRLLWKMDESGKSWRIQIDPLFLRAARSVLERVIYRLDKSRRTGLGIASRIRSQ